MAQVVSCDLLSSGAQLIVQQCNCVTVKAHGLSATIAEKLPYAEIYSKRSAKSNNTASQSAKGVPGTCVFCKPSEELENNEIGPIVACLMGQITPGKPGAWCKQYKIDEKTDNAQSRIFYFESGLKELRSFVLKHNIKSVAFPHGIGCGLAGGNWTDYQKMIDDFAKELGSDVAVTICKL